MRNEFNLHGTTQLAASPATPIMLYICALIAENCDLDLVADAQPTVADELANITDVSQPSKTWLTLKQLLSEHLYECFLDFAHMPINQTASGICLGALFKGYPALILRDESVEWMTSVFAFADGEAHARLLSVLHDFLVSEGERKSRGERLTDVTALIGHAESTDTG